MCHNIENVTFETNSRLKSLETFCFYDLYSVKSFEFGSDKLQTIANAVFAYNFNLIYLRFPASLEYIGVASLLGLKKLAKIEFCGNTPIKSDVFKRDETVYNITPATVVIKVTSGYQSTIFGINDTVVVDNSINCSFPHSIHDFDLQCITIYNSHYHISYSLFTVFILLFES